VRKWKQSAVTSEKVLYFPKSCISARDYQYIAPAVSDSLEFGDENIPITPENSDKLVEAVTTLRAAIPPRPAVPVVEAARKRLEAGIAAINQALTAGLSEAERADLAQAVQAGLTDLNLLSSSL